METFDSPTLHQILEPGLFSVLTIAMITLHLDNSLHHWQDVVFGDHAEPLAQSWVGRRFQRRTAEPAPYQHVKPLDAMRGGRVDHGDQPDVVRVWERAVIRGERHSNLELSGQERLAINGIDSGKVRRHQLLGNENFEISRGI